MQIQSLMDRTMLVNRMVPFLPDHDALVLGNTASLASCNTPHRSAQPAVYRPERGRG